MHCCNPTYVIYCNNGIISKRFIKLSDDAEDLSGAVVTNGVMQFAGVYCYELSNGVELLYGNNFDYSPEHLLAQRMALATTILSAIAWGTYLMAICIKFPSLVWLLVSLLTLVTCITQGIMFKFFDIYQCSDTDCGLSTSSRCGIAVSSTIDRCYVWLFVVS